MDVRVLLHALAGALCVVCCAGITDCGTWAVWNVSLHPAVAVWLLVVVLLSWVLACLPSRACAQVDLESSDTSEDTL
jgi:hypothetical protein